MIARSLVPSQAAHGLDCRLCGVNAQVASSAELAELTGSVFRRAASPPSQVSREPSGGRLIKNWVMRGAPPAHSWRIAVPSSR